MNINSPTLAHTNKESENKNCKLKILDPLLKFLSNRIDISDISLEINPSSASAVNEWEQLNNCLLPDDVKIFYTLCNGFHIKWNYKLNETSVPMSDCRINSLENLKQLKISSKYNNCFEPSELYLSCNAVGMRKCKFTDEKLFFELDSCEGYSKVCLVFNKPNYKTDNLSEPCCSVWFIDRSLELHYLTDSFTSYMILVMSHAAIKQWQYVFTDIGLPPQTRQRLQVICPNRLKIDEGTQLVEMSRAVNRPLVKFHPEKVFNIKIDNK